MEKDLKAGKMLKYINPDADYLFFLFKNEVFKIVFYNNKENVKIKFYGDFEKMLDTANELIFNHKLQICL